MSSHNTILTIQIVGWNSAKHLPDAIQGLLRIPDKAVKIVYIDNASQDQSIDLVKRMLPQAEILALPENMGFAAAHNKGFERCTTPYVMTHDPDIELEWSAIETLLEAFRKESVGAVQGKVLRREMREGKAVIDSAGIVLSKALNGIERGAFETDLGQWDTEEPILAPTGACALYRVSALHDVQYSDGTIFDADFFAYKEDVDLGWRLRNKKWLSLYVPIVVAHHSRTMGKRGTFNWGIAPGTIIRRLQTPRTFYSLRNWIWMMIKNASIKEMIVGSPFIAVRLGVFMLLSVLYPPLLRVWPALFKGIPTMIRKRNQP